MSDPTLNDPAVSRRVKLFVILAVIFILGLGARSSYAIEAQPAIGPLRLQILARFEVPDSRMPFLAKETAPPEPILAEPKFPPLRLPIPAGPGHITRDGGYNNGFLHLRGDYDQFALDLCEGSGCSRFGRHAIAPTDITYELTSPYSTGYHFFEVYDDGKEKLCMSLGHFDWPLSIYPSGAPEPGTAFPQGALLGELSWWGQMPHVHIGIWTMASTDTYGNAVKCHYWSVPRQPQPFTGQYQLDGEEYPACLPESLYCYNVHSGRLLESSNAAFSYYPMENPADMVGMFYEKKDIRAQDRRLIPAKTGDSTIAFE